MTSVISAGPDSSVRPQLANTYSAPEASGIRLVPNLPPMSVELSNSQVADIRVIRRFSGSSTSTPPPGSGRSTPEPGSWKIDHEFATWAEQERQGGRTDIRGRARLCLFVFRTICNVNMTVCKVDATSRLAVGSARVHLQ